jgi:hypothetical protein
VCVRLSSAHDTAQTQLCKDSRGLGVDANGNSRCGNSLFALDGQNIWIVSAEGVYKLAERVESFVVYIIPIIPRSSRVLIIRKLSASRKGHTDRIPAISNSPLIRESTNPSFGPRY